MIAKFGASRKDEDENEENGMVGNKINGAKTLSELILTRPP